MINAPLAVCQINLFSWTLTFLQEYTSTVSPRGSHLMSAMKVACKGSCSGLGVSLQEEALRLIRNSDLKKNKLKN